MSDGAFVTGWRVFRARRTEFIDPGLVRRRTVVAGSVAVVAGGAVVVSDLLARWTGTSLPLTVVAAVAFAAATGCFSAVFVRPARRLQAQPWRPFPGGRRRSERVGLQFGAHPPELLPEDRDDVLAQASGMVAPAVVSIDRLRWIPLGWLAAWVGVFVSGLAASDNLIPLLFPVAFGLLQGGTWSTTVVWLGRAELTRRRVAATPPYTPPPRAAGRNTKPRGSKLGLPGD
jgi:hypothetical protein